MARAPKLKVYRTPIGFHDAYVAAASQKAALAAWGTETNLFARGMAEIVTDEALTREPLAHPGEVVRRLRGSTEQQIAALPSRPASTGKKKRAPARPAKSEPRPSREALEAAEKDLEDLLTRQQAEAAEMTRREQALARERATWRGISSAREPPPRRR